MLGPLRPCLLCVPVLCVLGLCAFVLGVWCACVAFVYIVRPSPVNVVDIMGVRRPVLCAGAVHDCVVRACASHDRVACTCCACACSACLRCARLRFPCSRCVQLLCVPLLCVSALCARAGRVVCLCSACLHRATLADTTPLADPGDLTCPLPFPHSQSHRIAFVMHCSPLFAPFLACVVRPNRYAIYASGWTVFGIWPDTEHGPPGCIYGVPVRSRIINRQFLLFAPFLACVVSCPLL